ncbi:MAG: hypothetical protein EPO42_00210 [Gallionellaceae bacterium]|nr:MAG: hypothetical protein EPO42_00210 [Gallionellaceae bacterium]
MNAIETSRAVTPAQDAAGQLPSTGQLLVQGGDARIALNPATGANKYGCRPQPDANIAAFGSATSTSISEAAFFAANQLRNRVAQQFAAPEQACSPLSNRDAAGVYADEMHRIRHELIELCGLDNVHGPDIVFAASGTDSHLIAAQLAACAAESPPRMLIVDPAETGSGVPAALSGRHFSSRTALGDAVTQGAMIEKSAHAEVVAIPIRLADGTPRNGADIDADFERQAVAAAAAGQRVLLTMADVSKTGIIAPSVACAVALHQRFPDTLDVLVDACQFRIAPATLQAYLAQGFMVGVTGSKFITGPSFSGALFIPAPLSKKLRRISVAERLQVYSTRADWPLGWETAGHLEDVPNFGLLLRWEAALKELRAFRSVSNAVTTHFLHTFAAAIKQRLEHDPLFEALPVPELQRHPFADTPNWDNIQTVFPFLLLHPLSGRPVDSAQTAHIYRALQEDGDERVQLAQPVACGTRDGIAVSALRICASSRLVVEAMRRNGSNEQAVLARARHALDQVARLVRAL